MSNEPSHSNPDELPLSQETFRILWHELNDPSAVYCAPDHESTTDNNSFQTFDIANFSQLQNLNPETSNACNYTHLNSLSVPSSNNWKGNYDFDIHFEPQKKLTKTSPWSYSELKDKLYVMKGTACPIKFYTNSAPQQGTVIRAMAVYCNAEHAQDIVKRCLTHADVNEVSNFDHPAPDHLIFCDSTHCTYVTDPATSRHSVVVPYVYCNDGNFVTLVYKFMCWSSCVGGLNRRPIKVIFTLEKDGCCFGRRAIETKICACPGRDLRNDEKQSEAQPLNYKDKTPNEMSNLSDIDLSRLYFDSEPPEKKRKKSHQEQQKGYTIHVTNKKIYKLLSILKEALETAFNANSQNASSGEKKKNIKKETTEED